MPAAPLQRICVTIPCKGRLAHLRQAVPTWLAQAAPSFAWDILVIDYACPDGAAEWCRRQGDARLRALRFEPDSELFSLSHARNLGARWSDADAVLWIDADILVPPDLLERLGRSMIEHDAAIVHGGVAGQSIGDGTGERYTFRPCAEGTSIADAVSVLRMARRSAWEAVRGFDEAFAGWGWEDVDFRERIIATHGREREWFVPADRLTFLNHGAEDSVRFYAEKDKRRSADANFQLLLQRDRLVNPHGFGQGEPVQTVHPAA